MSDLPEKEASMTPRDLPETARPWRDPLGNVWCVTATALGKIPGCVGVYRVVDGRWREWGPLLIAGVHPDLLAGLGRTLPPVPTPKRVAKAVTPKGYTDELAAKGGTLYFRVAGDDEWFECRGVTTRAYIAAAHEAFQHAGDLLPGEEASDA